MKYILVFIVLSLDVFFAQAQTTADLQPLNVFRGTWVIFKDASKKDTVCITVCIWSKDHKRLVACQVVRGEKGTSRDTCYYGFDPLNKVFMYSETDGAGNIFTANEITIKGKTWIYQAPSASLVRWRTINIFSANSDEITYLSQRSDDNGKTWNTIKTGKEYKISK